MDEAEELGPTDDGAGPASASPTPTPRKRRVWPYVLVLLVLLIALPIAAASAYVVVLGNSFDGSIKTLEEAFPPESTRPLKTSDATNVLLLGSDSRSGLGDVLSGERTGQRADTMMLLHIPSDHSSIVGISLMRDLWTDIPGYGEAKLNAAFSHGGAPLAVQTIESLFGARIDHVAIVDFAVFGSLADALGGVDVWSDQSFESLNLPGYGFERGYNRLRGEAALAFVRERYAFGTADYQRVRNQQAYIRGVLNGFISRDILLDPGKASSVVSAAASHLTVDPGLTAGTLAGYVFELREIQPEQLTFFTLPTLGTDTSPEGESIVVLDTEAAIELGEALSDDEMPALIAAGGIGEER